MSQPTTRGAGGPGRHAVKFDGLQHLIGEKTKQVLQQLQDLEKMVPSSHTKEANRQNNSRIALEQRVFDSLAAAKIMTSAVSMHLDREWRNRIFKQIDSLHDTSEWEPGDQPVNGESFGTFLRTMLWLRPEKRPGLGMTTEGDLIAFWTQGDDRLTIQFLPTGMLRATVSRMIEGRVERAAIETTVKRLLETLASFNPNHWLANAKSTNPT